MERHHDIPVFLQNVTFLDQQKEIIKKLLAMHVIVLFCDLSGNFVSFIDVLPWSTTGVPNRMEHNGLNLTIAFLENLSVELGDVPVTIPVLAFHQAIFWGFPWILNNLQIIRGCILKLLEAKC